MGEITQDMREKYGHRCDLIPPSILARIDQDEVLDRLDDAMDYHRKADSAPADLARGFWQLAKNICTADPRDETEQQAQVWVSKADAAASVPHRATCLEQAQQVRKANPPATHRVRYRPTAEDLCKAEAVKTLQADITKAAAAKQAKQAAEDRAYREALAGRGTWTIGHQWRYDAEHPRR
ncbi:hypothetical protein [Streptacidiphilus sp. EB103A]|uniref:hypothetical protein n=1 Tax=Streptacidiphilus sp. EB103A TaxID=3156275 RepID=UPI0035198512